VRQSVLAVLLPLAISWAQVPPQPAPPPATSGSDQTFTFRSDVSLVTLTATITDASGRYAKGLRPEYIGIWEDGVRQRIALFRDEIEPVSVGIIFDTSGSMQNKIYDVIDAVSHFGATAQPQDEIFLLRFASDLELVMDFSDDRNRLQHAAQGLRAGGGTALYDAVAAGLDKVLRGRHRKKALVVISDGNDHNSRTRVHEVLEMARQAEVLVYCIGIGEAADGRGRDPDRGGPTILSGRWPIPKITIRGGPGGRRVEEAVDMSVLQSIAEAGGARAFLIPATRGGNVDHIDRVVQEVSAELRQQYTLGYYPSNPARDGTYRRIQITTSFPELQVRARRGYYAPKD
jgi:Ca-activated chloride channel family protein